MLGVTVLFLYVLFPSEALRAYLAYRLTGGNPDMAVHIGKISPALPAGLKIVPIRYERDGQPLFEFERLTVRPQWLSLIKGDPVYAFDGRAYDGKIIGDVGPAEAESELPPPLNARMADIRIDRIPALTALLPKKVTGRLSGTVTLNAQGGVAANLRLLEATVQLDAPLIGLDAIGFQSIDADIEVGGRTVTVKRGTLKGAELDATVSGSVQMGPRMEQATLNLRGTASPHHSFLAKLQQRLPATLLRGRDSIGFRLDGPIGSPGISFE